MPTTKFRFNKLFKKIIRPPLVMGLVLLIAWFGNQLIKRWIWDETDFIVIGAAVVIFIARRLR